MGKNHWLVKQEPQDYSWSTFLREGSVDWTGVRNFQARNNLRAMQKGDSVFFYHSGKEKAIVGTAVVERAAFPEAKAPGWVAVTLKAGRPLLRAVTLAEIKTDPLLQGMVLARNSRLSVSPVTAREYERILERASSEKQPPSA